MAVVRAQAGGLSVALEDVAGEAASAARKLAAEDVPARLSSGDPELWGPEAREEAAIRLGWLDLPSASRSLLPELAECAAALGSAGLERVVLAGMGGSSLAPEVITAEHGRGLTVLDSTDPAQVRRALHHDLERTVVVVSSKSGTTVETDSQRRAAEQVFAGAGLDAARRIVCVTDPGSQLADLAGERGYRLFLADPNVGGRYSALSAFGLVPSALAGVDVQGLLDEAAALRPSLAESDPAANPALLLGAGLGARVGRDKLVLAGSAPVGLADWIEQLVAESTGKQGTGLLPVVVEGPTAPGFSSGGDRHTVGFARGEGQAPGADTVVTGALGAQFLAWEYATAVAGRLLGINPFDQPNVAESKQNTTHLLESAGQGPLPLTEPVFTDGAVEVHAEGESLRAELAAAGDVAGVLRVVLDGVREGGYLAVMAYLGREAEAQIADLRPRLARRTGRAVTFGWGPRFLHSTGQYHKGGPAHGSFLQITGEFGEDLAVPGRPYGFGRLQLAQALGDFGALVERARPVVRLHLRDRAKGLAQLLAAG